MELEAAALHATLRARAQSVSCAESLTGGELAALLSSTPGASATFVGGVVTYATELKVSLLGVRPETVASAGVVSAECAVEMARGVLRLTGADWAVSTTGVAGPDSQEGKPVGTVYVGLAGPEGARAMALSLTGERAGIRRATCRAAVEALVAQLR